VRSVVLFAILWSSCLPNPQSVKERRETFDRSGLLGSLILESPPPNLRPVGAVFGGRIKLLGYTLEPAQPRPGDRITVTYYWTALKTVDEDYEVFIHGDAITGKSSRIHGDHFPAEGDYPTDVWQVGEIVADPFKIWIPTGYGPKQLGLYSGLYKDKYRVPLTDKGSAYGSGDNRSRAVEIVFP
jgi:hypothetical protein